MAGLVAFVLVVAGVVGWSVVDDEYVARPSEAPATRLSPAAASSTLEALEEAVVSGDRTAARELDGTDSGDLLPALVVNAEALRVEDFTLRFVDQVAGTGEELRAAVDVTWRFGGFDRTPARTEVEMTFRADGPDEATAVVSAIGGGDLRTPLWMSGPVEVRRSPEVLALGAAGTEVGAVARRARAAVPAVRGVLQRWQPRLVVEVPASTAGLDELLAGEDEYGGVAAVTASPDGSLAPDAPLHVFVNPDVLGGLRQRGAQVVITHEATHVATRAPLSDLPLWLLEGFADYVALRDVPLPLSTTAGQIIERVREDGLPTALPGPAEFDTDTTHLGAAYEAAWLACMVIAEVAGEDALVDLYRSAEQVGVARALRSEVGWTERELTRAWRGRLRELAA